MGRILHSREQGPSNRVLSARRLGSQAVRRNRRIPSQQNECRMTTADELRRAINQRDLARVDALLTGNPSLRQVLIDDVPLQALAQPGCIPIMELLVRRGADERLEKVAATPCGASQLRTASSIRSRKRVETPITFRKPAQ